MRDLFEGDFIIAWEDDGNVFISLCYNDITICVPTEIFLETVAELSKAQAAYQLEVEEEG